jgi:hypothetical protein
MAYTVTIRGSELIDALEDKLRDVYQNIEEDDRIIKVQLHFGDEVEIVIGKEVVEKFQGL